MADVAAGSPPGATALSPQDAAALERFRAYLRMRTVHPDPTPGYEQAGDLLRACAAEVGLAFERVELCEGHPLFILTWVGTDPALPSVVLNSHMDVVPVDKDKWTKDPFGAEVVDGRVYGRGTQDMKSVGVQVR